jgi:pimeloyl-ACP methyl ester carboxylesterase
LVDSYAPCVLLSHDVDGAGEAVVLLHSSVGDRRMFQPQWGPLQAAGYRLVRVDFRGHGESPAATEPYNDADDVREVLDSHGIVRAAVVGTSFGGAVAQEFAARWPDRVSALVLICSAKPGHPPTDDILAFSGRENELLGEGNLDEAVELNVRTFVGPAADDATRELVARMQRHTFEVQLAAADVDPIEAEYDLAGITARTLVLSGAKDLVYFDQIADHLGSRIPDARRMDLDWAGHLPSLENPALLNSILLDFLAA